MSIEDIEESMVVMLKELMIKEVARRRGLEDETVLTFARMCEILTNSLEDYMTCKEWFYRITKIGG